MSKRIANCIHESRGSYFLVKNNKWVFLTKSRDQIESVLESRYGFKNGVVPYGKIALFNACDHSNILDFVQKLIARARHNAKSRGKEFCLQKEDAPILLSECNYRCSVTRTPYSVEFRSRDGRTPFAPSIDRIDSSKGYHMENCRLVCTAANYAMNTWGESVIIEMLRHAKGVVL